jgi:hypothetical protein
LYILILSNNKQAKFLVIKKFRPTKRSILLRFSISPNLRRKNLAGWEEFLSF